MNLLAVLRQYQSRAVRAAAAAFAIGWLGFAVAPCQAMGIPSPVDAPPHGTMPMDDCDHCPPPADETPSACAIAAADDCSPATQSIGGFRQADQPKPVALAAPHPAEQASATPAGIRYRPLAAPAAPFPRATLQQRYCSYLK